ncbi:DNA mismatch repair protein MutS [Salinigranum salinum]|uniref:DNA mismatch repair protein MutS n=1 Tax=Salinigranum salinum TaxID=1364937 RepID=UPI001260729A|nr:DNA mismatch repair protein MutS [Salinigranum salinum]
MLAVREELTPMMAQYTDLCEAHDDALVLFQVGDFYEAFCAAAETVARVCEVTLTKREDSTGQYPMAGVPIDNAASYVERLLDAGYRVALADQVEPAEEASGLVDRAVTQLVTPGTIVDDELLEGSTANYLGAIVREAGESSASADPGDERPRYGFAVVDVSTGECLVTSGDRPTVVEEIERLAPAELLTGPAVDLEPALTTEAMRSSFDEGAFALDAARERVGAYARPERVLASDAEIRAAGAVLAYAEYTQGGDHLDYVSRVTRFDPRAYMRLDATALRSLELFESRSRSGRTLIGALDETSCALGRRRLEAWFRRPTIDRGEAEARLDAVEALTREGVARETLRETLREVYDLERLVGRVSRGRANARDLRSLATTLGVVPAVRDALAGVVDDHAADRLAALLDRLDDCADVRSLVERAIVTDPPQEITEGGVIREGFDADLDEVRATEREGREWVSQLEAKERERTGIDSLEVGYTQVHGYYIEVTNPNLDRVPDEYTRRQTLKNAERFYTPELKRREDEIISASERADALEYEVFREVRSSVADETERVQALADALAELDVLATFAATAVENDYTRPAFGADAIAIEEGRHPVVERTTEFVPNGVDFSRGEIALVTGPNMSGKSTYMRQIALTCVMAQAGSFVPASHADLRVVDRVFTRVGASDDIAGGQSTFMREMAELTEVLHGATEASLVLLDEVGRGTSTTDGLAIARATTEFLHDEVGATTLFATHYHELTDLADDYPGVFCLHFTAERDGDDVTFLHRVADGPSSSSYGVEVARLAGVPDRVVDRARTLVDAETGTASPAEEADDRSRSDDATPARSPARVGTPATNGRENGQERDPAVHETAEPGEKTFSGGTQGGGGRAKSAPLPDPSREARGDENHVADDVLRDIRTVDVARTTPMDALALLHELQRRLDDANQETRPRNQT